MADLQGYDVQSRNNNCVSVWFQFPGPGGVSPPAATIDNCNGEILSVVRTGVGTYTATLKEKWPKCVYADGKVAVATGFGSEVDVQINELNVSASPPTVNFTTLKEVAGVLGPFDFGAAQTILVQLWLKNGKAP